MRCDCVDGNEGRSCIVNNSSAGIDAGSTRSKEEGADTVSQRRSIPQGQMGGKARGI